VMRRLMAFVLILIAIIWLLILSLPRPTLPVRAAVEPTRAAVTAPSEPASIT
jgi:hypothetical protein